MSASPVAMANFLGRFGFGSTFVSAGVVISWRQQFVQIRVELNELFIIRYRLFYLPTYLSDCVIRFCMISGLVWVVI